MPGYLTTAGSLWRESATAGVRSCRPLGKSSSSGSPKIRLLQRYSGQFIKKRSAGGYGTFRSLRDRQVHREGASHTLPGQ